MLSALIDDIIAKRIVPETVDRWSPLTGGTDSVVGVFGPADCPRRYVVKANTPAQVAAEARFLQLYAHLHVLPQLTHIDPDGRYYIYRYVPGETSYPRTDKLALMTDVTRLMIGHYVQPAADDSYEWVEEPVRAAEHLANARSVIGSRLTAADHDLVVRIQARSAERVAREAHYVLHGDLGVHNFLFADGRLAGVIDPIPCAGRRLYDLLYAFCSSPDGLHYPILAAAAASLGDEPADAAALTEDMVLALYNRLATCLCHHPADWPAYQAAWSEWTAPLAPGGGHP